jgi:fucose 4-O-acetylase-like acetyltransferase
MMGRNGALDALRALAIVLVVNSHAALAYGGPRFHPEVQVGGIGVDLFFVLGGWLLDPKAFERLTANGPDLVVAFVRQECHFLASLVAAVFGVLLGWRRQRTRTATFRVLCFVIYGYITVAMFGMEAYSRCRVPVSPFLYVLAGIALSRITAASQVVDEVSLGACIDRRPGLRRAE